MIDSQPTSRPLTLGDVGLSSKNLRTIKVLVNGDTVQVNVFVLSPDSIDFDVDTRELKNQQAADALADFIRRVGTSVGAPVALSVEGDPASVFATYDPATDAFAIDDA